MPDLTFKENTNLGSFVTILTFKENTNFGSKSNTLYADSVCAIPTIQQTKLTASTHRSMCHLEGRRDSPAAGAGGGGGAAAAVGLGPPAGGGGAAGAVGLE